MYVNIQKYIRISGQRHRVGHHCVCVSCVLCVCVSDISVYEDGNLIENTLIATRPTT